MPETGSGKAVRSYVETTVRLMTRESGLLRAARLKKGFTQMAVAAGAGIDIRLYQRLEYGQRSIVRASLKTGLAICFVLDLDPMELVFGE